MIYNKGVRGPESTNDVEIRNIQKSGTDANPMIRGEAIISLSKGLRGVNILAQGKHAKAIEAKMSIGEMSMRLKVRWTGREAVTVTGMAA